MAVKNEDRISPAFEKLGLSAKQAVARGLEAGARQVLNDAVMIVHVDTGILRRSLTRTEVYETGTGQYEVAVGTNVEYAPYEEYGTAKPRREPHPYLEPALTSNVNNIRQLLVDSFRTEFES
jgi:HK97 gp10 family phage protein